MTPGSEKMGEGPLSEMEGSTQIDEVVNQLTGEGREDIRMVLIDKIHPSPFQAREEFDQEALDRLAESVEKTGLHHPLTVRKDGNGGFELVAGERRWRACKQIDREVVPCLVKDMDDIESRMVGLAENLAREDLTPIEEARGMARLKKALERADQNSSVRELKRITGRSIGAISEALKVARNLTDGVMADAEVTEEEVKQLPRTALVGLAKEENSAKRAEMLRKASKAEAPGKEVEKLKDSTKKQPDRRDPTPYEVRYSNAGRVLLRTHKPVDELSADQCRRILEVLTPAWEDLQDRAGG